MNSTYKCDKLKLIDVHVASDNGMLDLAYSLMLYVGLAYENGLINNYGEAVKLLETAEHKLETFNDTIASQNMSDAVRHIILSTKAHLFLQEDNSDRASSVKHSSFDLITS